MREYCLTRTSSAFLFSALKFFKFSEVKKLFSECSEIVFNVEPICVFLEASFFFNVCFLLNALFFSDVCLFLTVFPFVRLGFEDPVTINSILVSTFDQVENLII